MDYETAMCHAAEIVAEIGKQTKVLERIADVLENVATMLNGCQHYLTNDAQAFRTISVNRK